MPDVFALLEQDHREVEQLFSSFASSNDPATALKICDELTIHSILEEEFVYPVLAVKVDQGQAQEARQEHAEAKELINRIEAALRDGSDVAPIVRELQASVQHHVQEEESEVFPAMREKLPTLVGDMGDEVVGRKAALKEQLAEARSLGETSATVALKLSA